MENTLTWYDGMGLAHLEIPLECVESVPRQGACDDAIAFWEPRITFPDPENVRRALREYGAWDDDELADDDDNRLRILWIAVGDLQERPEDYA